MLNAPCSMREIASSAQAKNYFFLRVEIVIDTAILQIVCIAEICGGRYRKPFFNKTVKAYTDDFLRPLSLL